MRKKSILIISIIIICFIPWSVSIAMDNQMASTSSFSLNNDYVDITVQEAWQMLNDQSNGIQIPIDVRRDDEWIEAHIDTPHPENPKHHNFYEWDNPDILDEFLITYQGKEIILYCKSGGRSVSAVNILIDNNFNGIIYNMIGGITQWKSEGLPTVPNRPPEIPNINGPSTGKPGESTEFTVFTNDPDEDNVYYYINWSDGTDVMLFGPYESDDDVKISHIWSDLGIYLINIKAIDSYDYESNWTTFEFSLSQTEFEITEVRGGLGSVTIDFKNIGEFVAEEVISVISVKGGILSAINLTHTCVGCSDCGNILEPGMIKTESTRESGFIVGLGNVEILASVSAKNADELNVKLTGFVLGPILIIS